MAFATTSTNALVNSMLAAFAMVLAKSSSVVATTFLKAIATAMAISSLRLGSVEENASQM